MIDVSSIENNEPIICRDGKFGICIQVYEDEIRVRCPGEEGTRLILRSNIAQTLKGLAERL